MSRNSPHRLSRTSATAVAIAAIVFLAGAVNIYSAWCGIDPARVRLLRIYHLLPGPHSSRTLTVLAGMLLILLSFSLFRRKRQGWIAAVVVLSISLALHLLKGLDYEEASFTALVLVVLLGARKEFLVRSDGRSFLSAGIVSVVMVTGSLLYGLLGFALLQRHFEPAFTLNRALQSTVASLTLYATPVLHPRLIEIKIKPPAHKPPHKHGSVQPLAHTPAPSYITQKDHDAVWFNDSLVGIAFFAALSIAGALLRPVAASLHVLDSERKEIRRLLMEFGGAPLNYLALSPGLAYLFTPSRRAVLAYRMEEHVALMLGDPVGNPDEIPELIATFDQLCLLNDWRPACYQLTSRWLPLFREHGWGAMKIGEDAIIDLSALSYTGKVWQDVRTALNRLPREGCTAVWYNLLSDPAGWIPELAAISQTWLDAHHGEERGFSLGTWENAERYAAEQRMLVLVDQSGRPAAFLTFVPIFATGGGWALDLMRKRPSLCPGAMEFLLATAMQTFKEEGAAVASLGLSALSDVTPKEADNAPELLNRVRALAFEHFNRLYNLKGLHQFKEKFQPHWEARYLIYPSLPQLPRVLLALIRAHTLASHAPRRKVRLPAIKRRAGTPVVPNA